MKKLLITLITIPSILIPTLMSTSCYREEKGSSHPKISIVANVKDLFFEKKVPDSRYFWEIPIVREQQDPLSTNGVFLKAETNNMKWMWKGAYKKPSHDELLLVPNELTSLVASAYYFNQDVKNGVDAISLGKHIGHEHPTSWEIKLKDGNNVCHMKYDWIYKPSAASVKQHYVVFTRKIKSSDMWKRTIWTPYCDELFKGKYSHTTAVEYVRTVMNDAKDFGQTPKDLPSTADETRNALIFWRTDLPGLTNIFRKEQYNQAFKQGTDGSLPLETHKWIKEVIAIDSEYDDLTKWE